MEKTFLNFISNIENPLNLEINSLQKLNVKLNSFLEYVKLANRSELKHIRKIDGILRDMNAFLELSKIYDANAYYYRDRNYELYLLNKYQALLNRVQAYATEHTKQELEYFLHKTRETFYPLYPRLMNLLGVYYQLYEYDFSSAIEHYQSAINVLKGIDKVTFESQSSLSYEGTFRLFMNNMLDAMIRSPEPERYLKEIHLIRDYLFDSEAQISNEARLDIAELFAKMGKSKIASNLLSSIEMSKMKNINFYYPQINRVKSIIALKTGNLSIGFDSVVKSFRLCFQVGKPISQKTNMVTLFSTINNLLTGISLKERISMFKEKGFLDLIINVLETKDRYLAIEHSKNVANLSLKLWKILGGDEKYYDHIYFSGLFHDIGKLSIPWLTLSKPFSLDNIDREILRYHSLESYKLLNLLGFEEEAKVAGNHHERIDGSGYPLGKKNLTIDSEVVAIADVFQAASSPNRNYKNPKGKEEILKEIENDVNNNKFHRKIYEALLLAVK